MDLLGDATASSRSGGNSFGGGVKAYEPRPAFETAPWFAGVA
jgi:hypothetical protein